MRIAWNASEQAESYSVFRSKTGQLADAQLLAQGLTDLEYEDSTSESGVANYYWVQAVNQYIQSFVPKDKGYRGTPSTPTDILLPLPQACTRRKPVGTIVGNLTANDPNAGDLNEFSLVGADQYPDNAMFSVDGVSLKTAAVFNSTAKNLYRIQVRATDTNRVELRQGVGYFRTLL